MGAKRKLARRAVKRTYGSRRLSSCAPTAIAKDILAAPIGRSSSRQEAATAKRGGAGGEPHNGASLRSRRAAPVPAEHKNSRPRQPRVFIGPLAVGWILNLAVEWRPQRGQRLFLRSHCFRSSPSPCLPSCGRKSSPATVGRNEPTPRFARSAPRSIARSFGRHCDTWGWLELDRSRDGAVTLDSFFGSSEQTNSSWSISKAVIPRSASSGRLPRAWPTSDEGQKPLTNQQCRSAANQLPVRSSASCQQQPASDVIADPATVRR